MNAVISKHVLADDMIRKLVNLKIDELITYVDEIQADANCSDLNFIEKFEIVINRLYECKLNKCIERLKKSAKLRERSAAVAKIYYDSQRSLSRDLVLELSTCDFLKKQTNLIIKGPTGSGKTYLACALANAAMERCFKAKYVRLPDLIQDIEESLVQKRSLKRLRRRYELPSVLIIDEWLLSSVSETVCSFLLDLIDARYTETSTFICTQYDVGDWHEKLGGTTLAEAVIDRLVQNAVEINLGTLNMRKITSPSKFYSSKK